MIAPEGPRDVTDADWMNAAIALGEAARGTTAPNPNVGCVIVADDGRVIGQGATQPGGRPHAEAVALAQAGPAAAGATAYTSLEPCAHRSHRGSPCADALIAARVARVVVAMVDPDPRTAGAGVARMRNAGIAVEVGLCAAEAARAIAGFLMRLAHGRPFVTLKLAFSIDGRIALANGASRWITSEPARDHVHALRARSDAILVGRGTYDADAPRLDVRLPGLDHRQPRRLLLTSRDAPDGWTACPGPDAIHDLHDVNDLLVEGGGQAAAAFLRADLIDRLAIYTAPILIGGDGRAGIGDLDLSDLASAHGRWRPHDSLRLGTDRLDTYERMR